MALIICSYCDKKENSRWFPPDWKIVTFPNKNVLCNKVKCGECIRKGVDD